MGAGWEWDSGKAGWYKTEGFGDSEDFEEGRRTLLVNVAGHWHSEALG